MPLKLRPQAPQAKLTRPAASAGGVPRGSVRSAMPGRVAPSAGAPGWLADFPTDPAALGGGRPRAAFGTWRGLDPRRRDRLARRARVRRWRGPGDFVVEVRGPTGADRLVLARLPGAIDLAGAAERVGRAPRSPVRSWIGGARLGPEDGLRLPCLDAASPDGAVRLRLRAGPVHPPPEALVLGRGEVYRRHLALHPPAWIAWGGDRFRLVGRRAGGRA